MCGLLVGLGDVDVVRVDDTSDEFVEVTVRARNSRVSYHRCGMLAGFRVERMAAQTAGRRGLFRRSPRTPVLAQGTVALPRACVTCRVVDRGRPEGSPVGRSADSGGLVCPLPMVVPVVPEVTHSTGGR